MSVDLIPILKVLCLSEILKVCFKLSEYSYEVG